MNWDQQPTILNPETIITSSGTYLEFKNLAEHEKKMGHFSHLEIEFIFLDPVWELYKFELIVNFTVEL